MTTKAKTLMMSLLMIVMLLFGIVMPVAAQDGELPGVNCNGLSEADCELFTEASMSLQSGAIHSLNVPNMSFDMTVSAGSEQIAMEAAGSGRFVLPESAIAMFSDLPQGMLSADGYNMDAVVAFYESLDADELVQMLQEMGMQASVDNLMIDMPGETVAISLDAIFKDSALYVRLDSPTGASAWFGDELVVTDEMTAELQATLEEMAMALESPEMEELFGDEPDAAMNAMMDSMMPLIDLANSYVLNTREADAELFGQSMAVFTTTFDLQGFLAAPELPGALMSMIDDMMALSGEEMATGTELNESQLQFVLMTVSMLVEEATFNSTIWVGLDDMLLHKQAVDMAADLDLSLLGDPEMTAANVDLGFAIEMYDYNSTTMDDVSVPDSYLPLERTDDYIAGSPEMIERELALGETFSAGIIGDDTRDIYAIMLDAGQSVQIEVATDDKPYVTVYGPDGFAIESFDLYVDNEMTIDADAAGTYLVQVEAYWDLDYDITVRAQ